MSDLRVVVDNTVSELDVYNFQDIADCARRYADQLEASEQGDPFRCIVIAQTDEGLAISVWGENTTAYELMGLFEAAKLRVFADDAIADE
jgi:hypothetical protein